MGGRNHICWIANDGTFNMTYFDSITEIYECPYIVYYGGFCVLYGGGDQKYVGCEGSYVDYKGIRYEGEADMHRLMNLVEQEKIRNLLEDM